MKLIGYLFVTTLAVLLEMLVFAAFIAFWLVVFIILFTPPGQL